MVFSVSVLEHVPFQDIQNVCKDMFRLVRPGGYIAHSMDVNPNSTKKLTAQYFESLEEAGFIFNSEPEIEWRFDDCRESHILLEPLSIVYTFYGGHHDDIWETPKNVPFFWGTILIFGQKPTQSQ